MAKIAIFEVSDWQEQFLKDKLSSFHEIIAFTEPIQHVPIHQYLDVDMISVFIYSEVNSDILSKLQNLKLISTRSTGYDHIDCDFAKNNNIPVCNVPFYGENTVAEHTFGLILNLSRNIHRSYHRTLNNDFSIEGLMGFDLKGKTIGIIGGGHIGQHVMKIAKGFGMSVLVHDMNHNHFLSEILDFTYTDLDFLLSNSDIISLHLPYNKQTHHIINCHNIYKFKPNSVLINTARGGLVDTEALILALDSGILSGVGLDVIEDEELINNEEELLKLNQKNTKITATQTTIELLKRENVVYTPHIAFYSKEAICRILEATVDNLISAKFTV